MDQNEIQQLEHSAVKSGIISADFYSPGISLEGAKAVIRRMSEINRSNHKRTHHLRFPKK